MRFCLCEAIHEGEGTLNLDIKEELKHNEIYIKEEIKLNPFQELEKAMNLIASFIPTIRIVKYSNGENKDQFWIELYRKSKDLIGKCDPLVWIFKKNSEAEIGINLKESISDVIGFFLNESYNNFSYSFVNIELSTSETLQNVISYLSRIEISNSSSICKISLQGSTWQRLESKFINKLIDPLWKFQVKSSEIKNFKFDSKIMIKLLKWFGNQNKISFQS